MSRLWYDYLKFLDRRMTRFGDDPIGHLSEAVRESRDAAFFDFGLDGEMPLTRYQQRAILDPDNFYLPFEECAAEFVIPPHGVGAGVIPGRGGGRVIVLTERPRGHEVGFGRGEIVWPVMIGTQIDEQRNVIRLVKCEISGSGERGETGVAVVRCLVLSCCDYVIGTGKCLMSWHRHQELPRDLATMRGDDIKAMQVAATQYASWGLSKMEEANSPANWVVRVTDEVARVVKRGGKTTKEKRTRLIVVPDRDLDRVIRQPNPDSDIIERAPHRRRAHYRRLCSPRFRLKQGQRVYVKESWIGPKEAIHGGEHYEVLTALPSRES